jgi:hypothetical protein
MHLHQASLTPLGWSGGTPGGRALFREPAGMVMGPVERKIDCFGEVSPKHRADTEVARDAANALADSAAKQAPCGRP